jgi:hypothetical protein
LTLLRAWCRDAICHAPAAAAPASTKSESEAADLAALTRVAHLYTQKLRVAVLGVAGRHGCSDSPCVMLPPSAESVMAPEEWRRLLEEGLPDPAARERFEAAVRGLSRPVALKHQPWRLFWRNKGALNFHAALYRASNKVWTKMPERTAVIHVLRSACPCGSSACLNLDHFERGTFELNAARRERDASAALFERGEPSPSPSLLAAGLGLDSVVHTAPRSPGRLARGDVTPLIARRLFAPA